MKSLKRINSLDSLAFLLLTNARFELIGFFSGWTDILELLKGFKTLFTINVIPSPSETRPKIVSILLILWTTLGVKPNLLHSFTQISKTPDFAQIIKFSFFKSLNDIYFFL